MRFYWFLIPIVSLIVVLLITILYIYVYVKPTVSTPSVPLPKGLSELLVGVRNTLDISIVGFSNGSRIPVKYTCEGENISPEIIVKNIPNGTVSLVLIMYDPDAPSGVFYHWIIYNISVNGSVVKIPEGLSPGSNIGIQLYNDFNKIGYGGPCPPIGHGSHRYVFVVIGLNKYVTSNVSSLSELLNECRGYVTSIGIYIGTYSR